MVEVSMGNIKGIKHLRCAVIAMNHLQGGSSDSKQKLLLLQSFSTCGTKVKNELSHSNTRSGMTLAEEYRLKEKHEMKRCIQFIKVCFIKAGDGTSTKSGACLTL